MIFKCKKSETQRRIEKQKLEKKFGNWHIWFAWYPVSLQDNSGRCVWLQNVERKYDATYTLKCGAILFDLRKIRLIR